MQRGCAIKSVVFFSRRIRPYRRLVGLKKSAISLSIVLHADFFRLWTMPLSDFLELMVQTEEVLSEIGEE